MHWKFGTYIISFLANITPYLFAILASRNNLVIMVLRVLPSIGTSQKTTLKTTLWSVASGNWCLVLSFPSYLMRNEGFSNTTRIQCYHLHCLQWQTVNHKKDTTCWLLHYFYDTMIAVSCIDYFLECFMTYKWILPFTSKLEYLHKSWKRNCNYFSWFFTSTFSIGIPAYFYCQRQ